MDLTSPDHPLFGTKLTTNGQAIDSSELIIDSNNSQALKSTLPNSRPTSPMMVSNDVVSSAPSTPAPPATDICRNKLYYQAQLNDTIKARDNYLYLLNENEQLFQPEQKAMHKASIASHEAHINVLKQILAEQAIKCPIPNCKFHYPTPDLTILNTPTKRKKKQSEGSSDDEGFKSPPKKLIARQIITVNKPDTETKNQFDALADSPTDEPVTEQTQPQEKVPAVMLFRALLNLSPTTPAPPSRISGQIEIAKLRSTKSRKPSPSF
ncbi:hypothetical protein JTE90_010810 [Oedothorax gibbosus]|uniref:Uncharacterized protein n=1 Tax=Oedothorax gibbosus TaxID=931172 RepID=A0AAV6VHD4_9ARAC|nr:hypothetical protein JTE90_010810 [Oedothorax gibbosus]